MPGRAGRTVETNEAHGGGIQRKGNQLKAAAPLRLPERMVGAILGIMDIKHLSPDVESYVQAQISEGIYASAEEALDDAVRYKRQADEERHARLLKALAEGEQGEATPYSRELMNELAEAAHKDMLNNKPMDQRPSGAVLSPAERA
jgi:putative addiction module CopG family antidote